MIDVADLLQEDERLAGNYFAPDAYIQGDFEAGLIESRHGDRLVALPETLLRGIYDGIEAEIGQASGLVIFNCGRWWGKSFYARFVEEVSQYYGKSIAELEMVELLQCIKECWKAHGWGTFNLDVSYYQQGFLIVKVNNSAFAEVARKDSDQPACYLEAGILSSFFSQLTGQNLHCVQTECESQGADSNYFVIGLPQRLQAAEAWLEEGQDHHTIIKRLCEHKPSKNNVT